MLKKNQSIKEAPKSVTILSAYHRGLWLANELKSKNISVNFIDFTEKLGALSPETWEAPFGLLSSKKISYSQSIWLNEGVEQFEVQNGLTILSDKGPLEFQGPFLRQSLKRYGVDQDQMDYLRASTQMSDLAYAKFRMHFFEKKFSNIWAISFAHNIASSYFYKNHESILAPCRPLPLSENWIKRRYSRRGSMDSLRMSHDKGVEVKNFSSYKSAQVSSQKLQSLNFESKSKDESLSTNLYINFLAGGELRVVSESLLTALFQKEVPRPEWFWTKYRISIKANDVAHILPRSFFIVDDRSLSWTHENVLILDKSSKSNEITVWCRVPMTYRFQHNRLTELGENIIRTLKKNIIGFQDESIELPLECLASDYQIEFPHLPVFHSHVYKLQMQSKLKNFMHLGPENWYRLDIAYHLELQQKIFESIFNVDQQYGIKRRRGRDSEIYS